MEPIFVIAIAGLTLLLGFAIGYVLSAGLKLKKPSVISARRRIRYYRIRATRPAR